MKCRKIHLGCLLNLFVGAEWLPNDRSSLSLKHLAHGNLGIWLIRHFRDLWLSICRGRNKDRQLRRDPQECWVVYYWGFVLRNSYLWAAIRQQTIPGMPSARGSQICTCTMIKSALNTAISWDWNHWLVTPGILSVCTNPKDNICSGTTAFSSR